MVPSSQAELTIYIYGHQICFLSRVGSRLTGFVGQGLSVITPNSKYIFQSPCNILTSAPKSGALHLCRELYFDQLSQVD